MSRNTFCNISKLSACAGFLVCLTHGNSVFAGQIDPPTITMTAASSSRISQGEPFVVHYKVDNIAPEGQVTFHAGSDNDQWYTMTLHGPNGTVIPVPKAPEKKLEGFFLSPERSVRHGGSFTGDFIATRGLPLLPPGAYRLSVHVDTPYYAEPDGVGARYSSPGVPDPPTGTLVQDFTFPLVVTPADPIKLQALAEQWKAALLNPAQAAPWRLLTQELFSLPAAQALSAWQALVADPTSDSNVLEDAVSQLSRLKTDTAADLLVQMQHRPSTARSITPRVDGALAEMYNTGSPALRKHIKALAADQGAELGETLTGPSNPN